jgi:DNA-binding MarR family transcriptional regulator
VVSQGEVAQDDLEVADDIGMSIARLHRLLACVSSSGSKAKAGMDRPTFMLLATLAEHGPRRSGALAETLHSDPSTVSRQVAQLVKAGLVERKVDDQDGRATVLAATERGLALLAEMRGRRNAQIAQMIMHWPDGDRARFAELFERFITDYERHLPVFIAAFADKAGVGGEK